MLTLSQEAVGDWVVIMAAGDLDTATAPKLVNALDVDRLPGGRTALAVDLAGVTFCDSAGLSALATARLRLLHHGIRLRVTNPSAQVSWIFRITGLDRYFFDADQRVDQ